MTIPSFPSHLLAIAWSLLHLSLCLLTAAAAVAATPKDSVFRLAAVPCLLLSAKSLLHEGSSLSTSITINSVLVGGAMFALLQCINLMLFARLDAPRLEQAGVFAAQSGFDAKLLRTASLVLNLRGIGTPWKAKHVEDSRVARAGEKTVATASANTDNPQRRHYVLRQSIIICWQYVFLDVAHQVSLGSDPFPMTFEFQYLGASAKQWAVRLVVVLFSGLGPARVQIDLMYRLCGLSAVLIGAAEPSDWPPLFGSIGQAYSLRRFWT
ncbi:hypothetical protein E4U41_005313 [Claviceps citrina]|nr:hypothetical protein E4U41_005313 [Claviceps citrina]